LQTIQIQYKLPPFYIKENKGEPNVISRTERAKTIPNLFWEVDAENAKFKNGYCRNSKNKNSTVEDVGR
jgi:hypothetical protein